MADILNSRTDSVNAHTEYEENCLRMIALQDIKAGDQIFNTYNDRRCLQDNNDNN